MAEAARWVPAPRPAICPDLEQAERLPWLAPLLGRRGVTDSASARAFLVPSLERLSPPDDLPQLPVAVERLALARQRGEAVAIVADYDVDGITAAAQLVAVLGACGLAVEVILPERLKEGYGFQAAHAGRAADLGCRLILTADCGSSSHEAVAAARARGLDVIVTDHHLAASPAPAGIVEINPRRGGGAGGFADLSGSGLAFQLCSAFAARCGRNVAPESLLRMACLGTIADMVPLTGENRLIAALGLRALPDSPSAGLQALLRRAAVSPPLTSEDVAYRIAPRLNAAGRMASARRALDLLLTRDPQAAEVLAAELEDSIRDRRSAQDTAVEAARRVFAAREPLPAILVAWSPEWHRGVVGIAAGRIAHEFHRPTLLFAVEDGLAVGSGRSVSGIHLYDFLAPWEGELLRFGGHAQAVGLSASADQLPGLQARWEAAAASWPLDLLAARLEYEAEIGSDEIDDGLLAALQQLEPFGVGNPEPLLRVGPLRGFGALRLFGNGHLSGAALSPAGRPLSFVVWGGADRRETCAGTFEAIGSLRFDRYRQAPVLQVEDLRPWQAHGNL